jgi:hypothetical protein
MKWMFEKYGINGRQVANPVSIFHLRGDRSRSIETFNDSMLFNKQIII